MTTQTNSIQDTDIIETVSNYITNNKRSCPTEFIARKFGVIVLDMLPNIKKSGKLIGLRGRNGGLMIPGMENLIQKKTPVIKKLTAEDTSGSIDSSSESESVIPF